MKNGNYECKLCLRKLPYNEMLHYKIAECGYEDDSERSGILDLCIICAYKWFGLIDHDPHRFDMSFKEFNKKKYKEHTIPMDETYN